MEIVIVAPADFVFGVKRDADPARHNNSMGNYPHFRAIGTGTYMECGRACAIVVCAYEGAYDDRDALVPAMRDITSKFTPTRILGASDGTRTDTFVQGYVENNQPVRSDYGDRN